MKQVHNYKKMLVTSSSEIFMITCLNGNNLLFLFGKKKLQNFEILYEHFFFI